MKAIIAYIATLAFISLVSSDAVWAQATAQISVSDSGPISSRTIRCKNLRVLGRVVSGELFTSG